MSDVPEGFRETPLGPLPTSWEFVSLWEVVTQRRETVNPQDTPDLMYVGLEHLDTRDPKLKRWGDASQVRSAKSCFCPGDTLYGKLRPYLDKAVLAEAPGICSTDILVLTARERLDSSFLSYLMHTRAVLSHAIATTTGVNHPRTSWSALSRLDVRLPPVAEQHAIAHVLRTVQRAREATEGVIAAVRELKQSLMRYLFTYGPVPVHEAERVELQETEVGAIPADWEVVALGQAIKGTQYGMSSRAEPTGKYPMLRMNNLADGRVDARDLKYIDLDDDAFAKFKVNKGDVLFNRTNSFELVGKTSIFDLEGDYVFASYLVRVVPDCQRLLPSHLNYLLNCESVQARLKQLATRGVSQSNINATKLRGFKIRLPSLPEQREVVRILSALDVKIAAEETRRDALDELFHSLLHHLMTGKVRVPLS